MKTQKNTRLKQLHVPSRLMAGLVVLALGFSLSTSAARAQSFEQRALPTDLGLTVGVPVIENVDVEHLTSMDLSSMDAAWWKDLIKQHARMLRSSDEQIKEQALKNLIFFASNYPDQADLRRAKSRLYKIYRYDEREEYRILAVVALHATGDDWIMERLREDVVNEQSERVRRHTLHALADHYKKRGTQ